MAVEKNQNPAMGTDYSFYLKSIATYAPAFLGYNNSALARVLYFDTWVEKWPLQPETI